MPDAFDVPTVRNLLRALLSGDEVKVGRAKAYLERSLHPRAFLSTSALFKAKTAKEAKQQLIAVLQLHEYWTIDHTPDAEDDKLETLAQYKARMGLTAEDRDNSTPEFGYMGAIPLGADIVRPEVPLLGDDPGPDQQVLAMAATS